MKENNHNTCKVYLLNGKDRHFDLIEMLLACLKINMKRSETIDVETSNQWRHNSPIHLLHTHPVHSDFWLSEPGDCYVNNLGERCNSK